MQSNKRLIVTTRTLIDACRSACALTTTASASFTCFASTTALASAAIFNCQNRIVSYVSGYWVAVVCAAHRQGKVAPSQLTSMMQQ